MSNPQSKTPSPTHPPNPNPIITFSGHPIHSLTDLHEAIGTCLAMSTLSPSVFTPASGFTLYGNPVSVVDISKFAVQLEAIKEGRVPSILKPVEIRVPEESLHRLSWGTAKHLEDLSGQQGPGFQGNALCSKPAIQPSPTPSGHLDNPTPSGNSLKNAVERNPGYGQPLQAAPSQPTPSQRHLNNPLVSSGNSKKNAVERNPGYSQPALHATPSQPTPSQRHLNNPLGSSGNSKKNAVERNPGYSQPALQATPSQPTPSQRRDHVDNFIPLLLSGNTISKDASVESNPGYSQPAYNGSRPHFQSQRVMSQPSISISQSALNANAVTPPHFQSDGASRQSTTNVMTGYMDAATCQQPTLTRDNERESSSSSSDPRYHTTTASHLKPQPSMDLQNESAYAGSMSNVGAHPHRRGYTQREITQYIQQEYSLGAQNRPSVNGKSRRRHIQTDQPQVQRVTPGNHIRATEERIISIPYTNPSNQIYTTQPHFQSLSPTPTHDSNHSIDTSSSTSSISQTTEEAFINHSTPTASVSKMQMVQDSLVAKAIAEHQRQQAQRLQRSTQPRQRTGKKVYHPTADAQQPVSVSATVPQPLTSTSHSGQSIQYQSEVMQYTSRSHVDPSSGQSQSVEKHQTFSKPLPTAIANNDDVSLNAPLPKRQRTYTQQDGNLKRKSSASKIVLADDLLVEPQVVANAFSQNLSVPPSAEAFAQNLPVLSSAEAFANAFAQNSSVPPSAKALASAFAQNLSAPPSADAFASAFAQNSSVPPSAKALASAFAQNLSVPTPPLNQQNSAVAQNVVPQIPYTHSNWADEIQDVTFLVGWWPMVIVERMENLGFKAVYHLLSATEYIRYAQLCHPDRYAAIASMNQDQLEESMRCFNEQVKIWLFVLMSGPPPPPLLMSEIPTPSSSHKRKRSESCANEPLTHSPHIFDPDFFNLITLPLNVLPPTPISLKRSRTEDELYGQVEVQEPRIKRRHLDSSTPSPSLPSILVTALPAAPYIQQFTFL